MDENGRGLVRATLDRARRLAGPVFVLALAAGLSVAIERTALFFHVDRWITDALHAGTAPDMRFEDVLIVDIDEMAMASLEPRLGPWPYDRNIFARVADHLSGLGARRVVFNLVFSDQRPGDEALAAALDRTGNAWLAAQGQGFAHARDPVYQQQLEVLSWKPSERPPSQSWRGFRLPNATLTGPDAADPGVGVNSFTADDDGMLRRVPLMHESGGDYLPALHVAALFPPGVRPNIRVSEGALQIGEHAWPVDPDGNALLQVPGNLDMFDAVSFDRVVNSALGEGAALERGLVEGRTVFVGSTASLAGDFVRVPIHGRMAGLDVLTIAYVNLANNLVFTPRSDFWKLLFCLIAAVIPLTATNRRGVSEWMVAIFYGLGIAAVMSLNLVLVARFAIQGTLLFPILLSAFTLLGQMGLRMKTIHDDRQRYYLDKLAADEANALKSQFLSHMTHELRTPLTAIMGYNRLLAESDLTEEERKNQVGIIDKNCQHLLSLINNLLDQAKLEAGQMALDVGSVSVQGLVGHVADTLRPIAEQKGLSVEYRVADTVPTGLRVDEIKVRQILVNLGANAIKFTVKGGVVFDIRWVDGWLEVRVVDTGPGMGPEALGRIFEAFQQADNSVVRVHGGTGLGLTISRNLAKLMGGDIEVASELGKGSTFTLRMPAEGFAFPARLSGPTRKDEEGPGVEGTVLVADDTPDLRQLLSLYLRKMGLDVLVAENGREAVEIALAEQPSLVFMDMQMPVMDGIEAVRTLRQKDYTGTVLALTAQSERDRIEAMLDAGCDGYVEKPVRRERLEAIVRGRLTGTVSEAESSISGVNRRESISDRGA